MVNSMRTAVVAEVAGLSLIMRPDPGSSHVDAECKNKEGLW